MDRAMRNPSFGGIEMRGDAGALIGYDSPRGLSFFSTSSPPTSGCDHSSARSEATHHRN